MCLTTFSYAARLAKIDVRSGLDKPHRQRCQAQVRQMGFRALTECGVGAHQNPAATPCLSQGISAIGRSHQAGHSPTLRLPTCAHLFEELEGAKRRPAEDKI